MTSDIVARSGALEWQAVDEEVVIPDLRTACYLSLNRSGATLWPLIVAGTTREALVAALVAGYGIDGGSAARDVRALLAQLAAAALLEGAPGAPADAR